MAYVLFGPYNNIHARVPCTSVLFMKQGGVSHRGLAIYIKTSLKAKEELWKFKYFTMQKYILQKNTL